jgi:protein-S-isoprenylcysteine O-methyltransferase Ste14
VRLVLLFENAKRHEHFERRMIMSLFWVWVSLVVSVVLPPALVFSLAGRWDLWYVWAYAGILTLLFTLNLVALQLKKPDLLKERMKLPNGRAYWTGAIFPLAQIILQPIVAGLDHRFHWSDTVPVIGIVAGLAIVAIGMCIVFWAEWINPFFSGAVRIQADRGHRVISSGPYAFVRHPAYAGGLPGLIAGGLALNSWIAILPAVAIVFPVMIYRTQIEDQMLRDELAGYADYAAKVRYRLVPGVW